MSWHLRVLTASRLWVANLWVFWPALFTAFAPLNVGRLLCGLVCQWLTSARSGHCLTLKNKVTGRVFGIWHY